VSFVKKGILLLGVLLAGSGVLFTSSCSKINIPTEEEAEGGKASPSEDNSLLRFKVELPSTIYQNQCFPVVVSFQNQNSKVVVAQDSYFLQLSGVNPASELFSDMNCATALSQPLPIVKGESSKLIYIKPTLTQLYFLQLIEANGKISSLISSFNSMAAPSQTTSTDLKLVLQGPASFYQNECRAFTVSLQSLNSLPRSILVPLSLDLSGQGGGEFFNSTNCTGSAVTELALPVNQSIKTFSFKSLTAENYIFQIQSSQSQVTVGSNQFTIAPSFLNVQTLSNASVIPARLALSGVSSASQSVCAGPVSVSLLSSTGLGTVTSSSLNFTLTGNLGFQAYQDSGCLTPLLAPSFGPSTGVTAFYFKTTQAGTLSLIGQSAGLVDGSHSVAISAGVSGTAVKLAVLAPSQVVVGECSSPIQIQSLDGSNLQFPVASLTSVTLVGGGTGGAFYLASDCSSSPITSLNFAAGDMVKTIYYRSTQIGARTFTVDDGPEGLLPASHNLSILPGPNYRLTLSGPSHLNIGDCRSFVVTVSDSLGFASQAPTARNLDLVATGGAFYTDSSCQVSTTAAVVNPGQSQAVVYFKSFTPSVTTLTSRDVSSALLEGSYSTTVEALPAVKLSLEKPVIKAGECRALDVQIKDQLNGNVLVQNATTITLNTPTVGSWYQDEGCLTAVNSVVVNSGQSHRVLYFKSNLVGALSLQVSSSGLNSDSYTSSIQANVPHQIELAGVNNLVTGVCSPYHVRIKDQVGNLTSRSSPTFISLSGQGSGVLSLSPDCSNPVGSFNLSANSSETLLYYRNNQAQSVSLVASSSGLTSGNISVTVQAGSASQIAFQVAGTSSVVGQCHTGKIRVLDALGNLVNHTGTITLSQIAQTSFYSSADCSGAAVTSFSLSNSAEASFSMKATAVSSLLVTAQLASVGSAQLAYNWLVAPPSRLVLSRAQSTLYVNQCVLIDLLVQDEFQNSSSVTASTSLSVGGLHSGHKVYQDNACTQESNTLTLSAGQSSRQFYFKGTGDGTTSLVLSAASGGLSQGELSLPVQFYPAERLVMTKATSLVAGSCQSVVVSLRDASQNLVPATSQKTLNLTISSGSWFSNSDCSTAVTEALLESGQSQVTQYFRSTIPGTLSLGLASTGLTGDSHSLVVSAAQPSTLALSGPASVNVGQCVALTLQLRDSFGNVATTSSLRSVVLSGQGQGKFSLQSDCSGSATSVTFNANQSEALVYYQNTKSDVVSLQASSTGLTAPPALDVTVQAGSASQLVFKVALNQSVVGQCLTGSLEVQDSLGNLVGLTDTINLMDFGQTQVYTSADCSGSAVTSFALSNQSTRSFSFRSTVVENQQWIALKTGLSSGQKSFSWTHGTPHKISLQAGSVTKIAGECLGLDLRIFDSFNNLSPVSSSTTVSLTGAGGGGAFYSDASCSSVINSVTFSSGLSSRIAFYKSVQTAERVLNASVSGGTLTTGTFNLEVLSQPAVQLTFQGNSSLSANSCQPYTLRVVDSLNNPVNQGTNQVVTLLGSGNGSFYQNENCGGASVITQATIAQGQSQVVVYFKSSVAESLTLRAQAQDLLDGTRSVVVNPLAPHRLLVNGLASIQTGVCVGYSLAIQDSLQNPVGAGSAKTVNLGGAGTNGGFFLDAQCAQPQSFVNFGSSETGKTVYYKTGSEGNKTLTFVDTGLPDLVDANLSVNVAVNSLNGPAKLQITGSSNINTGTCSAYVIQLLDGHGLSASSSQSLTIQFAGLGSGLLYTHGGCGQDQVTQVTLDPQVTSVTVYYKNPVVQSVVLQASSTNLQTALHVINVTAISSSDGGTSSSSGGSSGGLTGQEPYRLLVSGPTGFPVGTCAGEFKIRALDIHDQLLGVVAPEAILLSQGSANGTIYSDPACSTPVSSFVFATGQHTQNFYYKSNQVQNVTIQTVSVNLVSGQITFQSVAEGQLTLQAQVGQAPLWKSFFYKQTGALSERIFLLKNTGNTSVTNIRPNGALSGSIRYKGGTFPGLGGGCQPSTVLNHNEQCTVILTYQPENSNPLGSSEVLRIDYDVLGVGRQSSFSVTASADSLLYPLRIAAGHNHNCLTYSDLSIFCFGQNEKGELGIGNTQNYGFSNFDIERLPFSPLAHYASQVVAGESHTCVLDQQGDVLCWGDNTHGQLGRGDSQATVGGSLTQIMNPANLKKVNLGTNKKAFKLSAGTHHTCALLTDGQIKCWGLNSSGQLGLGNTLSRGLQESHMGDNLAVVSVSSSEKAVHIISGSAHNCVILDSGKVKCWGENTYGQLGIGASGNRGSAASQMGDLLSYVEIHPQASVLDIASKGEHTCAIFKAAEFSYSSRVKCWGRNQFGQLGLGDTTNRGLLANQMGSSLSLVDLYEQIGTYATKLALGMTHSCALLSDQSVKCWGDNTYGQIGSSVATTQHRGDGSSEMGVFMSNSILGGFATDIIGGLHHTCVIRSDNNVVCWGRNHKGQLGHSHSGGNISSWGHSTQPMVNLPLTYIPHSFGFGLMAMARDFTCATDEAQNLLSCWGFHEKGHPTYSRRRVDFTSKGGITQLTAGADFVCALAQDKKVYCLGNLSTWLSNPSVGSLGFAQNYDLTLPNLATPFLTANYRFISAGDSSLCGITDATPNQLSCVGWNTGFVAHSSSNNTYYAAGSPQARALPTGASPAKKLALGGSHGCLVGQDNNLYCWGSNVFGQVGNNTTTNQGTPIQIMTQVADVQLGRRHSCAIKIDKTLWCWGNNRSYQSLPYSTSLQFLVPNQVTLPLGRTPEKLVTSLGTTCALMDNQDLWCYGDNSAGQLVQGHQNPSYNWVKAILGVNFKVETVFTGAHSHTFCARGYEQDKPVPWQTKCWGVNNQGQIGYGDTLTTRGSSLTGMALLSIPFNMNEAMTTSGLSGITGIARFSSSFFNLNYTFEVRSQTSLSTLNLVGDSNNINKIIVIAWKPGFVLDPEKALASIYDRDGRGGPAGVPTYTVTTVSTPTTALNPSSLTFQLWGGGGGGTSHVWTRYGGAGGYAEGRVTNSTMLNSMDHLLVWVAQGGQWHYGGGGGSSAIVSGSDLLILAASGGGAGYYYYNYDGGSGGAYGNHGSSGYTHERGMGATATANGAGGQRYQSSAWQNSYAPSGTMLAGGNPDNTSTYYWGYSFGGQGGNYGGGGGGGYYSGGAGNYYHNGSYPYGAGGGGGSNFISTLLTNTINPNPSSNYISTNSPPSGSHGGCYNVAGYGGCGNQSGSNGHVRIIFNP
jgi:alpha-tubulin suppressor-like RCC1 family protein